MKMLSHGFGRALVCVAAGILGVALGVQAGPPQKTSPLPATATNAPALEAPIPRSEFNNDLAQGKDPFYPRSTRHALTASTPKERVLDVSQLKCNGISGGAGSRVAIINNRNFAAGEDGEVTTPGGRMRIRCEEIKEESVVVSFGDPPRRLELRLRRGY